jgi:hypothetical protein
MSLMDMLKSWILALGKPSNSTNIISKWEKRESERQIGFQLLTLVCCSLFLYRFELIPQWTTYQDDHPGFMEGGSAWALQMYSDGGNGAAGAPKVRIR